MEASKTIKLLEERLAHAEAQLAETAKLEAAARESDARHRLLIGTVAQAVWETDASGVVTTDSPSWRAYTGQTLAEWLGYGWLDAVHPDDRAYAERQWREAMAARSLVNAEFRLRAPDGGWRWTNVRAAPVLDATGNIEKWAGINIDIDARKRAEAALIKSEAQYRLLFDGMADGFCVLEVLFDEDDRPFDYTFLKVNPSFERQTGLIDPIGRSMLSMAPKHEPFWIETYGRIARGGKSEQFDHRADALGRWYEVEATPVGEPGANQVAVVFRDILQRRKAEEALRDSEERQAFLLKLSDALRPLSAPSAVAETACRVLVEHLGASRAQLTEVTGEPGAEVGETRGQYIRSGQGMPRRYSLNTFGEPLLAILRAGRSLVLSDTANDLRLTEAQRDAFSRAESPSAITVPLIKDGCFVANLTVHDHKPREWTASEIIFVEETAERTWAAMERARVEEALREREADLARVQRIGEVGGLDIDIAHGLRSVRSPEYLRLHGLPQDGREESHADWLARVYPDDRHSAEHRLFDALDGDAISYDAEYRIVRPLDGAIRWIHARADIERDEDGKAVRLVGAHTDVTEQKKSTEALRESEARLAAAFQSVPVGLAVIDMTGRTILSNAEYRRFLPNGTIPSRDPENVGCWRAWDGQARPLPPHEWPGARALRGETVVPGQDMLFKHESGREIWTTVATAPTRDVDDHVTGIVSVISDIDVAKRAQESLGESEERYRALFESMDEAYAVVDVLKDELGAWMDFRFVEVNPAFIAHTSMPWPVGKTATELLGAPNPRWINLYGQALDTGKPIRVEEAEPILDRIFDLNIFPLNRDRNRVAVLFTNITERKRAETALRESEERFQQFANASASGLWIRNAKTLGMEFVSPAIASIYGTSPDAFSSDIEHWAAMIVPEDRNAALDHIEQACKGKPAIHEFRIRRSDGSYRWIRNTDFPLYDETGNVERIGGIAEDVTEAKMAVEHQGILLAELQHRVRNIMAIIRSTVIRSADGATDVNDYKSSLAGRLLALARVQTLLTRQANRGGSLRGILESEIGAQAHSENQYELTGPDLILSPKAVEVLTLAFHELSTNALKYGALSVDGGRVSVTWTYFEKQEKPWLAIDWVEEGVSLGLPQTRRGFGSELIEAKIPYELRGTGKTTIEPTGARCRIEFPLREAESILETDAPAPTQIYAGAVDMTGAPDLTGKIVLVVEDDYYVASDTAAALKDAGAEVIGPCSTEEDALRVLEKTTPTDAVLDLNLGGGGPRFEIAHKLVERGTPFVFLTGYDPDVIPDELAEAVRLQKPVVLRDIVTAVSKL